MRTMAMTRHKHAKRTRTIGVASIFASLCLVLTLMMVGCSTPANVDATGSLKDYEISDMSGYSCSEGYEGEYRFVDMTVDDILAEMDAGTSFVLFAGFADCPWCNSLLNPLNDIATEKGLLIGYLDTRRNPAWKNNKDVEGYDKLAERIGAWFDTDDDGSPHLYVPEVFYIKDGEVVTAHQGTVPEQEDPKVELTPEQIQKLKKDLAEPLAS